jgi:hypothetical protein
MTHRKVGFAALALLMGASFSSAATITFTESAIANGSLGSNSFTDALITLTATGNTSDVTESPTGFFRLDVPEISIDIAGLGNATYTGGQVFSCEDNSCLSTPPYPDAAAGFSPLPIGHDILDTIDEGFNTYNLATSIGPIASSSLINPSFPFATNRGAFEIASAGEATFTASVGTATPEPATAALLGIGLFGLAFIKLRK